MTNIRPYSKIRKDSIRSSGVLTSPLRMSTKDTVLGKGF